MDELFDLPPAAFTAARDALAKKLKAEGDEDAAAEVKALRRPTVAAWAVNQVARSSPELIDAVVAAGAALADAQSAVLGGGDKKGMRTAMAARRDAVAAATRAAVKLAGEAQRDAISATFDAAATDESAAEAVRAGRLTKELDAPSGFGGDLASVFALPEPAAPSKADEEKARKAREKAEKVLADAEAKADAAELRRASLEQELAEATEAAESAAEEARRLREALDDLD